jgi:hypothetical protein
LTAGAGRVTLAVLFLHNLPKPHQPQGISLRQRITAGCCPYYPPNR